MVHIGEPDCVAIHNVEAIFTVLSILQIYKKRGNLQCKLWNTQCSQMVFSLRQFTSVMIAGLNRSVTPANNGSKGPRCKIDDDERQQSAMGT